MYGRAGRLTAQNGGFRSGQEGELCQTRRTADIVQTRASTNVALPPWPADRSDLSSVSKTFEDVDNFDRSDSSKVDQSIKEEVDHFDLATSEKDLTAFSGKPQNQTAVRGDSETE